MRSSFDLFALTLGALALCACRGEVVLGGAAGDGGIEPAATAPSSFDSSAPSPSGSPSPSGKFASADAPDTTNDAEATDASNLPDDLSSLTPAPPGLAGFAFVVNGHVQHPMACPSDNWEFPPPAVPANTSLADTGFDGCNFSPPGCAGVSSAILINTGSTPLAYIAASLWNGVGYVPGVLTGESNQIVGVLDPGGKVDITPVYDGGSVAVLGSADPFSSPDAGKYESDEGTIPWPAGVAGSGGATQMWIAEIETRTSCALANKLW